MHACIPTGNPVLEIPPDGPLPGLRRELMRVRQLREVLHDDVPADLRGLQVLCCLWTICPTPELRHHTHWHQVVAVF